MTMQSTLPQVFFGGDAAFGPKNIIWAVAHGHDAAISIDLFCRGEDVAKRPPPLVNLVSQKMGIHEWSYDNAISNDQRFKVPLKDVSIALKNIKVEVELGFDAALAFAEAQRCLNCDVQTVFAPKAVHRMRRLRRHLPDGLHHVHRRRRRDRPADAAECARAQPDAGPLCRGRAEDRPHHGQGRGRLPALRPVRRALSDRRLGHAEVLPRDGASRRSLSPARTRTRSARARRLRRAAAE